MIALVQVGQVLAVSLSVYLVYMELTAPFYPFFHGDTKGWLFHLLYNIAAFVLQYTVSAAFLTYVILFFLPVGEVRSTGWLLNVGNWLLPLRFLVTFLIMDFFIYFWHFSLHKQTFLRKLHKFHHMDVEMDVSSSFRIHVGEKVLATILFHVIVAPIFGLNGVEMGFYTAISRFIILIHHSNWSFSEELDRKLRTILATPLFHKIHHSVVHEEHDSNYGAVFSIWDRIFGTANDFEIEHIKQMKLGLVSKRNQGADAARKAQ